MRPYSNVFAETQNHGEEFYENINPLIYRQMILHYVRPVIVYLHISRVRYLCWHKALPIIDDLC